MLEKQYKALLDFICQNVEEHNFNIVLKSFRDFIKTEFDSKTPLVFATLDNDSANPIIRDFYNNKVIEEYPSKVYQELMGALKTQKLHVDIEGDKYRFVEVGFNGSQSLYLVLNGEYSTDIFKQIENYIQSKFRSLLQVKELQRLQALAHVDDVTGLYNQRKFKSDIDAAIREFEALERSFSLIFIDIDYFKSINDGHGHLIGTSLLQQVAETIRATVREDDLCYRYGGDEFVVLAPYSSLEDAKMIGQRILNRVKSTVYKIEADLEINTHEDEDVQLSVSIGVANYPTNASGRNEIIGMADRMMYEAKKSGRGKVCVADS
ncbi:GGDEF domain-containing protein [Halobacteriovorax sp. HFRX-2_2]|uniref:GGDEF domain-containing protein n=2 Tax=Halobacteriovorax TaxID=1652133 RepID=UPI0037212232